jgi:hypothetical protein
MSVALCCPVTAPSLDTRALAIPQAEELTDVSDLVKDVNDAFKVSHLESVDNDSRVLTALPSLVRQRLQDPEDVVLRRRLAMGFTPDARATAYSLVDHLKVITPREYSTSLRQDRGSEWLMLWQAKLERNHRSLLPTANSAKLAKAYDTVGALIGHANDKGRHLT